jgi:hypothetical protein
MERSDVTMASASPSAKALYAMKMLEKFATQPPEHAWVAAIHARTTMTVAAVLSAKKRFA